MTPVTVSRPPTKLPPGKHLALTVAIIALMFLAKWVTACASNEPARADLAKAYGAAYRRYYTLCIEPASEGEAAYFTGTHQKPATATQLEQQRSQCAAASAEVAKLQHQINADDN